MIFWTPHRHDKKTFPAVDCGPKAIRSGMTGQGERSLNCSRSTALVEQHAGDGDAK